ncbi:unnamed protein product [Prorocentrum cordatum]|uniref:Uncharacterized protein n=1 Tax=Prorocentrum cordatum TaxID=2364126 RepID=A0ABN9WVW8_9DINO|nr:unnamed protein product [Polarella glacialis]
MFGPRCRSGAACVGSLLISLMSESASQDESCSGSECENAVEVLVGPKGHRNLAIRGGVNIVQCCCSMMLAACGVSPSYFLAAALCSVCSAITLFYQWHTANPWMFVARGVVNVMNCLLSLGQAVHLFRHDWLETWGNDLMALKVCHVISAALSLLKARSLFLQYRFPRAGMGIRGNEQLFYRGCI